MKTLMVVAIMLMAVTAEAGEKRTLDISKDKGYTEIQTKTNTLRVYPCGKVEKLVWKEINPNEEPATSLTTQGAAWLCSDERGAFVPCVDN